MTKSLLLLCLLTLSFYAFSQTRVVVNEPQTASGDVTHIQKNVLRAKLSEYIATKQGFQVVTREINEISSELAFQLGGMVNEADRKKLGMLSGVDFICISKITEEDGYLLIEAQLVSVETGKVEKPVNKLFVKSIPNLEKAAIELAEKLVGLDIIKAEAERKRAEDIERQKQKEADDKRKQQEAENRRKQQEIDDARSYKQYGKKVEGTSFNVAINDEPGTHTYNEAINVCANKGNGWRLPTKEELNILFRNSYIIGSFSKAFYWSSTTYRSNVWIQTFFDGDTDATEKGNCFRVRCIRNSN